ncbi:MAG: hypothetical protein NXI03_01125 [Alphaproteobacteria bacterium]|uniref:hypothetical protein n=1 Tax=Maricaulis alexandrii TaxID=2570354 RepID=UPI001109D8EE|nr:hypothetical protein [Maricaulis alexandrii]MCR9266149.1 hypothetical protein [Alphaproteobacteria bacterium]
MTALPQDIQLALVSFLVALFVGGPVALLGASNVEGIARIAGGFLLQRRLMSGVMLSLLGGMGLLGGGLFSA